jgi:hypothetical protein
MRTAAGLYLQVSQQATKAWIFRFTRAGRPRKMGLGPVSSKPDDKRITLADARQKTAAARSLLIDGIDPIAAGDARHAQEALADAPGCHFQALRRGIPAGQPGKLEKRSPPAPMGIDAENLRLPRNRAFAGVRGEYGFSPENPASDLDRKIRDCEPCPRSDRIDSGLGENPHLPGR